MKIAVIERLEEDKYKNKDTFNRKLYLSSYFQEIFTDLEILWIPIVSEKFTEEICDMCDGLLITGSANDVHPKYYNEKKLKGKEYKYDEFPMVKKAVELFNKKQKPILGICAGIQEINVVFGGSLNQKIEHHNLSDNSKHKIEIKKDSILYDIYHKQEIEVNSYHSQSVNKVAPGFKVTAISEDGVIEGIEKENILAVQWHPEVTNDIKLFKKFIDMCQKIKKNEI